MHVWQRMAAVVQCWMCRKLTSTKLSWFSVIGTRVRKTSVKLLVYVAKAAVAGSSKRKGDKLSMGWDAA